MGTGGGRRHTNKFAHEKHPSLRTLQQDCTWGTLVVLEGGAVSYEVPLNPQLHTKMPLSLATVLSLHVHIRSLPAL